MNDLDTKRFVVRRIAGPSAGDDFETIFTVSGPFETIEEARKRREESIANDAKIIANRPANIAEYYAGCKTPEHLAMVDELAASLAVTDAIPVRYIIAKIVYEEVE